VIRLNRPKAINAVTLEMFRDVDKALDAFEADPASAVILLEGAGERGLCAGGDIRALWESSKVKGDLGKILWREEYILNARIAKFPKPYVAFMDGIVMGGGVGLSAHGSHRVVTERTKLAMPEVGLGFFPDVGGTWLLSHSPGEIGTYFGLTGQTMNGPDAIYAGFADAVVPSANCRVARGARPRFAPARLRRSQSPDRWLCDRRDRGTVAAMQPQIDAGSPMTGWKISSRAAARWFGTGAIDAEDAEREVAARHGGHAETAAAGAGIVLAGGMPGAGISRRAGSVRQRRFSRGRARRRDRQGPQSKMVAAADRGRDAGDGRALLRRDRRRRTEIRP
jgi:enoyl-CoA hydratase/carnithine racemase